VLWAIGGSAFQTYLGLLLQNITHLNGTGIGVMFLLFGLAGVLGNALGGYGADRWGPVRTLALSLSVFTIALLALPLAAVSVPGTALMLAVCGVSGWMFIPPQQHRLIAFSPEVPGLILSLNSSAIYFGIGGGAAIGGLVLHFAPVTMLSWVGSAWVLIALCVLFLSARLVRRGATHPAHTACSADAA
jgi:DHA1 family putative efflux transporter-like MFS transporter